MEKLINIVETKEIYPKLIKKKGALF